jgi:hypothetical protein
VAVLDLQQHAAHVLHLTAALAQVWSSQRVAAVAEELCQVWQVHSWLLDCKFAGGKGLQDTLTEQQLQQCRAAWDELTQTALKQPASKLRRDVFAQVQRMPIAWQQPPQMKQLSITRDGVYFDGALLLDIAGRTAAGVLVAVEADGPSHFRQPDRALTGLAQYRNRALLQRGYKVIPVPYFDWNELKSAAQQQQYLKQKFLEAGVL